MCVKTTIASKGNQLQLGILSTLLSSNEYIKLLKIIRTFDVSNIVNNDLWYIILTATIFAVIATYHTTL